MYGGYFVALRSERSLHASFGVLAQGLSSFIFASVHGVLHVIVVHVVVIVGLVVIL